MQRGEQRPKRTATLDSGEGVIDASFPRRVQDRTQYDISIPKEWARLLSINEQGAPVEPKLITGDTPVVISEQAIVFRPHPNGGVADE